MIEGRILETITLYMSDFGDVTIVNFYDDDLVRGLDKCRPDLDAFAASVFEAGGKLSNYVWDYAKWQKGEHPYRLEHTEACGIAIKRLGGDGAMAGRSRVEVREAVKAEIDRIQADPPLNVI